jgi:hypothetical protein
MSIFGSTNAIRTRFKRESEHLGWLVISHIIAARMMMEKRLFEKKKKTQRSQIVFTNNQNQKVFFSSHYYSRATTTAITTTAVITITMTSIAHCHSSLHEASSAAAASASSSASCCLTPINAFSQQSNECDNNNNNFLLLHTPGSPHPRRHCMGEDACDDRHECFSFETTTSATAVVASFSLNVDRLCLPSFDDDHDDDGDASSSSSRLPVLHLSARSSTQRMPSPLASMGCSAKANNDGVVDTLGLHQLFLS